MAEDLAGSGTSVVTEAPSAAPAAPAPSSPASPAPAAPTEGSQPEKPQKTYTEDEYRKAIQSRLAKESRRLERIARAEARAEFAERQLAERTAAPTQQPKGPPDPTKYQDVTAFVRDLIKYEREQEREAESRDRETRQPLEQAEQQEKQFAQSIASKLSAGPEKHDDFEDVVYADGMEWTPPMIAYIHDSDDPIELSYQLGLRREELRRISKLPPGKQVAEVVKFEAKLREPPKPTTAPAPIVPGSPSNSGGKKDWSEMNTAEHVAAWRSRKKR